MEQETAAEIQPSPAASYLSLHGKSIIIYAGEVLILLLVLFLLLMLFLFCPAGLAVAHDDVHRLAVLVQKHAARRAAKRYKRIHPLIVIYEGVFLCVNKKIMFYRFGSKAL